MKYQLQSMHAQAVPTSYTGFSTLLGHSFAAESQEAGHAMLDPVPSNDLACVL
jgi:hypothetical protein